MTQVEPPSATNPFWAFSLKLYASVEVQQACLALQDDCGVDVNILLYLLWLSAHGEVLTDQGLQDVLAAVEPWKAGVVVPLRTARRSLKSPPDGFDAVGAHSLRSVVKKAELESERLQQSCLYNLRPVGHRADDADAVAAAAANLASYARALRRELAKAPVDCMLSSFAALLRSQ